MFALKMFVTVVNVILIISLLALLLDKKNNGKGVYAMLTAIFFVNTLFIWY